MKPKIGSMTPWGVAQQVDEPTPGLVFVSTASHGGVWLDDGRLAHMRPALRAPSRFYPLDMGPAWFEEDCEILRVVVAYPEAFKTPYAVAVEMLCKMNVAVRDALTAEALAHSEAR
jgi:hypothetical protein